MSDMNVSPEIPTASLDKQNDFLQGIEMSMQKLDLIGAIGQEYCNNAAYTEIYKNLVAQAQLEDTKFAQQIGCLSQDEQFIFTMHRWSVMVREMERDLRTLDPKTRCLPLSPFERIRLPVGCFVQSYKSDTYYLNLGVEAKTLQGSLYVAHAYTPAFIDEVIEEMASNPVQPAAPNYAKLIGKYSLRPTVAIKYYDKFAINMGTTLNGISVREKPLQELKVTKLVWKQAHDAKPLLPWLFEPHRNMIRLVEYWDDPERNALLMVLEFANCGELLMFIDSYHSLVYQEKKLAIRKLDQLQNASIRQLHIQQYQNALVVSKDGQNAYIELMRYIFQQIVQAIYTLHCQGFAHLDISCENFVLHFSDDGRFVVKLIDFGRATKMNKNGDDRKHEHAYEKYDWAVSTYPGKCRYMSPESSLFLKAKDAAPYDASKQDLYSLGVTLYCLLTCSLPYDSPFYLEKSTRADEANIGYLNGDANFKIDLQTLRDLNNPFMVLREHEIDDRFRRLLQHDVRHTLYENCLLDYVSHDSLDLLNKLLVPSEQRLSLAQLIRHPFVCNPPDAALLTKMLEHVADFKRNEFEQKYASVDGATAQMHALYAQRLHIKALSIFQSHHEQEQQMQQLQQQRQKRMMMQQQQQQQRAPDLILPPHIAPMIQEGVIAGMPKNMHSPSDDSSQPQQLQQQQMFPMYNPSDLGTPSPSTGDPSIGSFVMSFTENAGFCSSPSPPPEPAYQYSPSPEMVFSPDAATPNSSTANAGVFSFYSANRGISLQQQQQQQAEADHNENKENEHPKAHSNNNHTDAVQALLSQHFMKVSNLDKK